MIINKWFQSALCIAAMTCFADKGIAASLYDFNTPGQLSQKFYATGGSAWQQNASGGLGGSGWVKSVSGNTAHAAQVLTEGFAGATTEFTVSVYFQWQTLTVASSGPLLYIGIGMDSLNAATFTPMTSGGTTTTQALYVGINATTSSAGNQTVRMAGYSTVNGASTSFFGDTTATGLVSGNWYHLSARFVLNSTGNGYNLSATLANSSASGEVGTSLGTYSISGSGWVNPTLVNGTVHPYFITGSLVQTRGIAGIDNFAVIPEPSSSAALILSGAMLAGWRISSGRKLRGFGAFAK